MNKSSVLSILYLFFLIVPNIYAKSYYDRGLYGSLGFSYLEEDVKSNYSYSHESFMQEYKLGYRGNIYSPKLLDYELEGLVRFEEYTRGDSSKTTTKSDSQDYRVDLKFIQASKFPFRIYANKNERPTKSIANNFESYYTYESENSGISGSVNLKPFSIQYGASESNSVSDSLDTLQKNKVRTYNTSLRHAGQSSNFQINYNYLDETIDKNYFTATNIKTNRTNESLDAIYNLDISKELKLDTIVNYDKIDYLSRYSKSSSANLSLYWRPKSDYSGSLYLSGSRYDTEFDINTKNRFDVFSISQDLTYMVTPTIAISESASQYNYYGGATEGINQNISLGITHIYTKALSSESSFMINSGLSGQYTAFKNSNEDDNTNISETFNRYTFNTTARVGDQLPSIDSTIDFNVNYYYAQMSSDEFTQKYGSSLSLSSNIMEMFYNSISASVSKSENKLVADDINGSGNISSKNSLTTISIKETFGFTSSLTTKGNIKFKAGIVYSNTIYDDDYLRDDNRPSERIQPLANINITYRLVRNLILTARASVNVDLVYENTNYAGSTNLSYVIGKTSISASYNYTETVYEAQDDGNHNNDYKRSDFKVNLVRTF